MFLISLRVGPRNRPATGSNGSGSAAPLCTSAECLDTSAGFRKTASSTAQWSE